MKQRFASLGRRLLFPPLPLVALTVLTAAVLLNYVFLRGQEDTPLAYAAYTLSAYALMIACTAAPGAIRALKRIQGQNEYIHRFVSDYAFRMHATLSLGLALNLAFAVFKSVAGLVYGSYWLIALGFYYAMLALMRFFILRRVRRDGAEPGSLPTQYKTYRLTGALMFALNVGMTAIIVQVVRDNRTYSYPGTIVYAFGAYAFYKITMAVVNLIRRRRESSPLFSAARQLNLAAAMMSIFSLQTALLSMFGGESGSFRLVANAATGSVICLSCLFIAVRMVISSTNAIRALRT